tara:strand:- start:245 stop:991 length:747 start_codon:yes stop_codon:yes gene_type:complete
MKNTAIIIPTRLGAQRFPNKPLAKINNLPMIIHVLNRAQESKVGEVFVATPDKEIIEVVKKNGGKAVLTKSSHTSGSDRVYEVYENELKNKKNFDLIINLQGDMPNIKPSSILKLAKLMSNRDCDIGTLASNIKNKKDMTNPNIVKVNTDQTLTKDRFLLAKDFFRIKNDLDNEKIYHHIGIYAFTNIALTKYVKFAKSKLELERNLEQMRAMDNNLSIKVGLSDDNPLGVDTEEDLINVTKEMLKNE